MQPSTPPSGLRSARESRPALEIWLSGDVLGCACPECRAPMSIRLWLMTADCSLCGTSVDLTEEEERAARNLVQQATEAKEKRTATATPAPTATSAPTATPVSRKSATDRPRPASMPQPAVRAPAKRPASASLAPPPVIVDPLRWLSGWWRDLPPWLMSLIAHLLLFILLSLHRMGAKDEPIEIRLSTAVRSEYREGGDSREFKAEQEIQFDLPTDPPRDAKQRQVLSRAQEDARQLRIDPAAQAWLPDVSNVRTSLSANNASERMVAAHDPRLRAEIVASEGGTLLTEAAVARGLYWLAEHQNEDGSWSLDRFSDCPKCRGRCRNQGSGGGEMAGTALALLPFLGAGQSPHLTCRYRDVVGRGLKWIVDHQDRETGDLRGDTRGNGEMYVHGQATIVLSEALAMTGDETLRQPAQRALDFIAAAQHPEGGWRYRPLQAGDTSVLGWQLMALHSGRSARLEVRESTLKLADQFLDRVESRQMPGLYSYMVGASPIPSMTAEALLCRMYLGAKEGDPSMERGIQALLDEYPPHASSPNIYYWYYATQVMHHRGGKAWDRWNVRMREALVSLQETRGHQAGSFAPSTRHDVTGGRIFTTSLAICTLEVYYRHVPIFRRIDLR